MTPTVRAIGWQGCFARALLRRTSYDLMLHLLADFQKVALVSPSVHSRCMSRCTHQVVHLRITLCFHSEKRIWLSRTDTLLRLITALYTYFCQPLCTLSGQCSGSPPDSKAPRRRCQSSGSSKSSTSWDRNLSPLRSATATTSSHEE